MKRLMLSLCTDCSAKMAIGNIILCRPGEWVADPRLSELGQRAVLPGVAPSPEGAQVIYGRQYRSWRIEHGVAEGNEMPAGVCPAPSLVLTRPGSHQNGTNYESGSITVGLLAQGTLFRWSTTLTACTALASQRAAMLARSSWRAPTSVGLCESGSCQSY